MIRTIVVDDEWYNLEEICGLVEKTGFMSVDARCRNGADALKEAARVHPQAAFIDIEMPEMDGLTLAEKLLETDPRIKIVFITGWNQYAVAAFELNALDYIMKPVNKTRFAKMAQRLKDEVSLNRPAHMPAIRIRCFGRYDVTADGSPVVWGRAKAEELFAFLLMNHGVSVHKDVILENLWPDYERSKSLPILQTSVCKIRNVFSSVKDAVKLTYADSKYGLYLSNVDFDVVTMENALRDFDRNRPETFPALESACRIFQLGLFRYSGYLWSEYYEESMRQKLAASLKDTAEAFRTSLVPQKELDALELLSHLSPTDEDIQLQYLNLAISLETDGKIAEYAAWLEQTLKKDYDTGLPPKTKAFLKNLIK